MPLWKRLEKWEPLGERLHGPKHIMAPRSNYSNWTLNMFTPSRCCASRFYESNAVCCRLGNYQQRHCCHQGSRPSTDCHSWLQENFDADYRILFRKIFKLSLHFRTCHTMSRVCESQFQTLQWIMCDWGRNLQTTGWDDMNLAMRNTLDIAASLVLTNSPANNWPALQELSIPVPFPQKPRLAMRKKLEGLEKDFIRSPYPNDVKRGRGSTFQPTALRTFYNHQKYRPLRTNMLVPMPYLWTLPNLALQQACPGCKEWCWWGGYYLMTSSDIQFCPRWLLRT